MSSDQIDEGPLAAGDKLETYKVRQLLRSGPRGTIYAAIDPTSGQKVAIKALHAPLCERAEAYVEASKLLATLDLPGLVRVRSAGLLPAAEGEPQRPYVVSDYMPGRTLAELIVERTAEGGMPAEEARPLVAALAGALAGVHRRELFHGDLKPDNIFLTPHPDGSWPPAVAIADFGLAPLLAPAQPSAEAAATSPLAHSPGYLSPAQCHGAAPCAADDIYALGAVAYHLITGELPFADDEPAEVMRLHREGDPRSPRELAEGLDPETEALILRALARDPAQRFASMDELRAAFEQPLPAEDPDAAEETNERDDPDKSSEGAPRATEAEAAGPPTQSEVAAKESGEAGADAVVDTPAKSNTVEIDMPADQIEVYHAPRRRPAVTARTAEVKRSGQRLGGWLVLWLVATLAGGMLVYRLAAGSWPWTPAPSVTAPGMLEISTSPRGAVVYLDRVPWHRQTPVAVPVKRGKPYDLYIFKKGYLPLRRRVALGLEEAKRSLALELVKAARWGTVQLTTNHKADIFWDSRRVGTQTTAVNLAEVRADVEHRVRLVAPGYETILQRVRVEAGKVKVLKFELRRVDTSAPRE